MKDESIPEEKIDWKEWKEVTNSAHNFEENPIITGVLTAKLPGVDNSTDYIILNDKDEEILVYGKTVLKNKLANVELGTLIGIEYVGNKISKKNKMSYQDYNVYIKDTPKKEKKE